MALRHLAFVVLGLSPLVASCSSTSETKSESSVTSAQALVDQIAARNGDVVRLTIHAVPTGKTTAYGVASTSTEKRGKPSDVEDMKVMSTGDTMVLQEGANTDVTLPIRDAKKVIVATAGVTLANPAGRPQAELVDKARAIAAEIEAAVQAAKKPLW